MVFLKKLKEDLAFKQKQQEEAKAKKEMAEKLAKGGPILGGIKK